MFKIFKMNRPTTLLVVVGHLLFWFFNYWFIAFGSELNWNGFTTSSGSLAYAYSYGIFFNIAVFYLQAFWLFPKFFLLDKKLSFYVLFVISILVFSIIETYFDYLLYMTYDINEPLIGSFITNTIFHILYGATGFFYILNFEYTKNKKLKQELLEESFKTELKYLKAQLNPHFLFNGINNIYHLIDRDNVLAKETLLQFSGLLRYQLYESGNHILLEKELDYILKYIKIEEVRRKSDIELDYDIKLENPKLQIAPLLLIPFIENAFKHCSYHIDNTINLIKIKIEEAGGRLTLNVENSFDDVSAKKDSVGGIGLQNVKKRLFLLYPDKHKLNIEKSKDKYKINLSINL